MNLTTINESFRAAFLFCMENKKRGVQAQLAAEIGVDPSNISAMKKRGKGFPEGVRRAIFLKLKELDHGVSANTYDDFLSLGQWILDGHDGKDWKPSCQLPVVCANSLGAHRPEGTGIHIKNKAAIELAEWIDEASANGVIDYGEAVKSIVAREFGGFLEFLKKRRQGGGVGTVPGCQDRKTANGSG